MKKMQKDSYFWETISPVMENKCHALADFCKACILLRKAKSFSMAIFVPIIAPGPAFSIAMFLNKDSRGQGPKGLFFRNFIRAFTIRLISAFYLVYPIHTFQSLVTP